MRCNEHRKNLWISFFAPLIDFRLPLPGKIFALGNVKCFYAVKNKFVVNCWRPAVDFAVILDVAGELTTANITSAALKKHICIPMVTTNNYSICCA
jgi:hypothetical protein